MLTSLTALTMRKFFCKNYENDPDLYPKPSLYTLPTQTGQLTDVGVFNFGENQLTGTVPTQLGQLTAVTTGGSGGWIQGNSLSSSLPTQIGGLTRFVSEFHCAGNKLEASLPTEIAGLSSMVSRVQHQQQHKHHITLAAVGAGVNIPSSRLTTPDTLPPVKLGSKGAGCSEENAAGYLFQRAQRGLLYEK